MTIQQRTIRSPNIPFWKVKSLGSAGKITREGLNGTGKYHYCDVIMSPTASQITSPTIVISIVYSSTDQRKHQRSALLAFGRGIHRRPVNSPHKWPVTRIFFPFDDVIMRQIKWSLFVYLWVLTLRFTTDPKSDASSLSARASQQNVVLHSNLTALENDTFTLRSLSCNKQWRNIKDKKT